MSAAAEYDPGSGALSGRNTLRHRSGAERDPEKWTGNLVDCDAGIEQSGSPAQGTTRGPSLIDVVLDTADPSPDELLWAIEGLAAELDHCIVRLAHASSAGIADRDLRVANSSAAEWVRRTLEDIVATSAGIRFAGWDQLQSSPAREDLPAAG
ncbi:hypothetical protein E2F48_04155 [Arthrobacter crusticola]|uniref:Uncharacterized protein n=1 Tax=Arthrobacter crusticola TaxID=2547960 RepID=A0A4V3AMV6_9MICC|nr:hypothetical protein [Arthrobacter crusticola]TDK26402.1 hypothetical protein E2F48_04155 [Arthrobacter crusticola]